MSSDQRSMRGRLSLVAALAVTTLLAVSARDPSDGATPRGGGVSANATGAAATVDEQGNALPATALTAGQLAPTTASGAAPAASEQADEDHETTPPPGSVMIEGGSEQGLAAAGAQRTKELSEQYRDAANYPPWSYVVPAGHDPVAAAAKAQAVKNTMIDGSVLDVSVSSWSLSADETFTVTAHLSDETGAPAAIGSGYVSVLDRAQTGYHARFALTAGKDGTAVGTWRVPPAAQVEGDPGIHVVQIDVVSAAGTPASASTSVQIGAPRVALTGRYRSGIVDGSLVLSVEVTATRRTRAHLAATIAPITALSGARVFAQKAEVVEIGTTWIDVVAYGKALRSLGEDGPYRITALQLSDTSTLPAARAPAVLDAFTTPPYSLAAFRDDSYGQQDLEELARFVEER